MLSVAVYSPGELSHTHQEGLSDGVLMIAKHMGMQSVDFSWNTELELPTSSDPTKHIWEDFKQFAPNHVLHIFAAQFGWQGNTGLMGRASFGNGLAAVNVAETPEATQLRMVTAHEAAHSLGFVWSGSEQSRRGDQNHCRSNECIMRPSAEVVYVSDILVSGINAVRKHVLGHDIQSNLGALADSFCPPCQTDLELLGPPMVETLQQRRERGK